MADVTREELRDLKEDLVERLTAGFTGVHARLDKLNGRVGTGEVALGQANVRLTNLEREVFRPRRRETNSGTLSLEQLKWYLTCTGTGASLMYALMKITGHL